MIGLLIAVATVLGLGYFVARHAWRFRTFGAGAAAGSRVPELPSEGEGRAGEAIPGARDVDGGGADWGGDSADAGGGTDD